MHVVVQYLKADGRLLGVWQAEPTTRLPAEVQQGTETDAYAITETELEPTALLETYFWHDGALHAKGTLVITAAPNPFAADGVTECHVSVSPFAPCTLLAEGQEVTVTDADPVLELTADSPHTFIVSLKPMGAYMATTITVEAH